MEKRYLAYLEKLAKMQGKTLDAVVKETESALGSVFAMVLKEKQEEEEKKEKKPLNRGKK